MNIRISLNTIIIVIILIVLASMVLKNKPEQNQSQPTPGIFQNAASAQNTQVREIQITAKQYTFSPNVITLKVNEPVRLRITTADVTHGFSIPELNINETISPGNKTIVPFTPTKKGTFTVICSITCGSGHSGMKSTIIVQ